MRKPRKKKTRMKAYKISDPKSTVREGEVKGYMDRQRRAKRKARRSK